MKVALGLKAHSGWAALVVIGKRDGEFMVVDRRRVELALEDWAKQPYHAAENLKPDAARDLVKRGVESTRRIAIRQMQAALERERERDNEVAACAVLVADPMPDWSVEEILAVHFRMHRAEGVLFRDVLVRAANACGLRLVAIQEKLLTTQAEGALRTSASLLVKQIANLGKSVGAPWGKDQKDATLAAWSRWRSARHEQNEPPPPRYRRVPCSLEQRQASRALKASRGHQVRGAQG